MASSYFSGVARPDDDGHISVSEEWTQGRGIYGGVPAAAMVHAMITAVGRPEAILRSLTVHFCAPLDPGSAEVNAKIIRSGRRVTHCTAEVVQQGLVKTHCTASFAAPRVGDLDWREVLMPKVTPPDELPSIPVGKMGGPRFSQYFDYRFPIEPLPLSGADTARLCTWIRPVDSPILDTPHAVGLLDAGAPAVMSRLTAPRAMASIDFRIQFFTALPLPKVDPTHHWLLDTHARVVGDGYSEEMAWLFAPDGSPVATCQQLIAIFDG